MRPIFYRCSDKITVCLLPHIDGTVMARGISVCSGNPEELYIKRVGRAKAEGRAWQACCHRKDVSPIRGEWESKVPRNLMPLFLAATYHQFAYKGYWLPDLTTREKLLVAEAIEAEKRYLALREKEAVPA